MSANKDVQVGKPRVRGNDLLRDPILNKGRAFTLQERQMLGLHGLLPPRILSQDEQVNHAMENFNRCENELDRFTFMIGLQDRNEKLFYRVVMDHIDVMMPVIYTPTVGLACQKYGLVFRRPRGLYITIHDLGHVYDVMCNWPVDDVKAICVTDGERILGLGDLGAFGMGIPVGKLSLYTACGGIQPHSLLPITIDVGTNTAKVRDDPLYIGLREARCTDARYDQLIDEFMEAVVKRYGRSCLIQFEDFGNHNAFRFLEKYRNKYCTFNDDIQGTASVGVAGILASLQISGTKLGQNTFVFQGAGEASIGIARLLCKAMVAEGMTESEALGNIWLVDSKGLIVKDRPKGGVTGEKVLFAKPHEPIDSLEDIIASLKPTAIIGAAAIPQAFTPAILRTMAENNKHPIIFALSNPTSKAECTAQQAYEATDGRAVFASGSPFPPVTIKGKELHPGQGNNAYIFPGLALAIIAVDIRCVTEDIFLASARSLAAQVSKCDLDQGRVYPPLHQIRSVSLKLAEDVVAYAYDNKLAYRHPKPQNIRAYLEEMLYDSGYDSCVPALYSWPAQSGV